ncbi:type II/IV secretion system family protein [Orientia tsutsugamushi str. UT76]|nr:type II/IV secretion system family protein [Orientia tsutsugamushi str. UT76]
MLAKMLKSAKKASKICFAGLPLVKNSERLHILITGTTGTGKTNMLNELLPQIRLHKDRAIIVDTTGAFTDRFFDLNVINCLILLKKIVSNGCLGMIVLKQLIFMI